MGTELKDTKEECKNMCESALAQENASLKRKNKAMEKDVRDLPYFVNSSEAMTKLVKELRADLNKRLDCDKECRALTEERNQLMDKSERLEKTLNTERSSHVKRVVDMRKEHEKQLQDAQDKADTAQKKTECA